MYLASNMFYTSMDLPGDSQSFALLSTNGNNNAGQNQIDELLNNTPASMRPITCCPTQPGSWVFTNTRNNNFTNRDQKLIINVTPQKNHKKIPMSIIILNF